tara:strand:- start:1331 stop:1747 length:417 start_codon:yes stop_codon:yes gene_type:complete
MNSLIKLIFFISIAIISCTKEDNFPNTYVEESIWITSPQYAHVYANLWAWDTIPGGLGGIIFIQSTNNQFIAYDRACTVETSQDCVISDTEDNLIFSCSKCCNSKFLIVDGSVSEGSADQALKRYNTYFDGDYLYISN